MNNKRAFALWKEVDELRPVDDDLPVEELLRKLYGGGAAACEDGEMAEEKVEE